MAKPIEQVTLSYLRWSVVWFFISIVIGIIISLQMTIPSFLSGISFLHFGRLRPLHVNSIAFGWLTTCFFGLALYMTQRLCRRPLIASLLAEWALPLWNGTLTAGLAAILLGHNQGLELAEFPMWVDVLVVVCFIMIFIPVIATIAQGSERKLYVSLWYIVAAFIWTALNYLMGNTLPVWLMAGAAGANIHSTYLHDVVGLWVTPMGVALMYYFLPLLVEKPIFSHRLSLIGFWSLAFFYPLNTAHHYLLSPIPVWVQVFAIAASVMLVAVVYTVMHNFFATLSGKWASITTNVPLRFLVFGAIFYILTCTQGPLQTQIFMQKIIHFTDWVVGHSHMALLGVFTFWNFSAIYFLWEQFTGNKLSQKLSEWHFWLTFVGCLLFFNALWMAGLVQGFLWQEPSADFMTSVRASLPFWWVRSASGTLIVIGQCIFVVNLFSSRSSLPTGGGRV